MSGIIFIRIYWFAKGYMKWFRERLIFKTRVHTTYVQKFT